MIELDKRDIENIAERRYMCAKRKRFLAIVIGSMAVMIVVAFLLQPASLAVQIAALVVLMALMMYALNWFFKGQTEYVAEFVKQCEADPELEYRPEPKGDK